VANETGAGNWLDSYRSSLSNYWDSATTSLKEGLGVPDNPRTLGEIFAHMVRGKPGQMYHRFMETPIGEQEDATITEADYKPEHLDIMRQMARLAMEDGRYSTLNQNVAKGVATPDYANLWREGWGGTSSELSKKEQRNRYFDIKDIGNSLGSYRWEIRDGQVYAVDDYDFNQAYWGESLEDQLGLPASSEDGLPYSQEALRGTLEERGWSSEREFPWWSALKTILDPTKVEKATILQNNAAMLARLHSPPFEDTTIPVDINLGTVSDVYGPMHYNRPMGGIIGR
jgi:hypothetical protein